MRHFTLALVVAVALLFSGGAMALPASGLVDPFALCVPPAGGDHLPFSPGTANGVVMPGATVDFCLHYGELRGLLDSALINVCTDPQFQALCDLLVPCVSDINGQIVLDERSGSTVISVSGNGIADASNELAAFGRILNNPSFDNGTLDYATVLAAYEHNFYQLQCDMGFEFLAGFATIFPTVFSGLTEIIAAHITIGDGALTIDSSDPAGDVTTATGSWGVASGIVVLLCKLIFDEFGLVCPNGNIDRSDYQTLDQYLSANGDADGDQFTNIEESLYYTAQASCGTVSPPTNPPNPGPFVVGSSFVCPPVSGTTYLDAMLDPNLKPITGDDALFIQANPYFPLVGGDILLKVITIDPTLDLTSPSTSFQWKIGASDISGEMGLTLSKTNLTSADNGIYYCQVDDGSKAPILSQPYALIVNTSVPVGGGLAMGLLAGACALAGAMGIRRKN